MNKKLQKKMYCKIQFKLASPLMIGSGENYYTDRDVLKDGQGRPFIPGSAIAGVCRTFFEEEDAYRYFGHIADYTDKTSTNENSRLVFYDAKLLDENYHITQRDGVGLDEYKTAIKGCKFDMEIVEPGVKFVTYIEQNFYQDDISVLDIILEKWQNEELYFGAKTMRGYGAIGDVMIGVKNFDFSNRSDVKAWLEFDIYNDLEIQENNVWKSATTNDKYVLELDLQQSGGCMVRKYTTEVLFEQIMPDFEQLALHDDTPVIPGTSWSGAFYHRMRKFVADIKDCNISLKDYFGYIESKKSAKSLIRFTETQLTGGYTKILTRTAINRFTGGVVKEALYTEKYYYGGRTTLKISVDNKSEEFEMFKKILAATVTDLHYGYLAVGGSTSVGRGLFQITHVNGMPVKDDVYSQILETMKNWG